MEEDSNTSSLHVKAVGVDVHAETGVLETGPARRRTLQCVVWRGTRVGLASTRAAAFAMTPPCLLPWR
jgi:hypothetical protein